MTGGGKQRTLIIKSARAKMIGCNLVFATLLSVFLPAVSAAQQPHKIVK